VEWKLVVVAGWELARALCEMQPEFFSRRLHFSRAVLAVEGHWEAVQLAEAEPVVVILEEVFEGYCDRTVSYRLESP
jgi:hypothetical protein